jgi:hypothetical protein
LLHRLHFYHKVIGYDFDQGRVYRDTNRGHVKIVEHNRKMVMESFSPVNAKADVTCRDLCKLRETFWYVFSRAVLQF